VDIIHPAFFYTLAMACCHYTGYVTKSSGAILNNGRFLAIGPKGGRQDACHRVGQMVLPDTIIGVPYGTLLCVSSPPAMTERF